MIEACATHVLAFRACLKHVYSSLTPQGIEARPDLVKGYCSEKEVAGYVLQHDDGTMGKVGGGGSQNVVGLNNCLSYQAHKYWYDIIYRLSTH